MSWDRDLIGIPYEVADCRQVALAVLDSLGVSVPSRQFWQTRAGELTEEAFRDYLDQHAGAWQLIHGERWEGVASDLRIEPGDIVVSNTETGPHLSVVVDAERRVAITSSERMGSMALRVSAIRDVRGVWRLRE